MTWNIASFSCRTCLRFNTVGSFLDEMILLETSIIAKKEANTRHDAILNFLCEEYIAKEDADFEVELECYRVTHGPKKAELLKAKHLKEKEEEYEKLHPKRVCLAIQALQVHEIEVSKYCSINKETEKYRKKITSMYTVKDAFMELWRNGLGPFGYMSIYGFIWKMYVYLKRHKNATWDINKTDIYDIQGSLRLVEDLVIASEGVEKELQILQQYRRLPLADKELSREYYEEVRCLAHLQLLMLNAAEAKIARDIILFQKFLREQRFKLMSNGINPPLNIFKTSSYASIDIVLVAVWLYTLSTQEKERFYTIKTSFFKEMYKKDQLIDAEDENNRIKQLELKERIAEREQQMLAKRYEEFQARHYRRQEQGITSIEEGDEVNTKEALSEIDGGYSCIQGEYGRNLQFVDSEFPPNYSSIGNIARINELSSDWKTATAINMKATLFESGTDPDDVNQGILNDSWLLSAISIVAASGGIGDDKVDPLIDQLFYSKETSSNGSYAVRLFKNDQWETIIIDDYFPVLSSWIEPTSTTSNEDEGNGLSKTPNASVAFAYSKNFSELWIPLLEKAYAKYHGSYASLEEGFVHHALRDLTGYKAEEICLASISRGSKKNELWKQLLEYKHNNFMMGAGTIVANQVDQEILDSGLVFGACYVIYEVRTIDNQKLLKLRNPPGNHAEWKGDWSDNSKLWNRRLRYLLSAQSNENDNTFWMSYDDFCHTFRCLYVCHYYDPQVWPQQKFSGEWKKETKTASGLPNRHNPNCILEENPQYVLRIDRPTQVLISIKQIDDQGFAALDVLPWSVYIVMSSRKDRAVRVKELTKANVVEWTGEPRKERQLQLTGKFEPRTYIIYIASYLAGMEGKFELSVQSNFSCFIESLWPTAWKQSESDNLANKLKDKLQSKLKLTGSIKSKILSNPTANILHEAMKDDTEKLQEEINKKKEEEEKLEQTINDTKKKKHKSPWIEQWDEASGKPYYYNKKTGMSSWEKPADL